MELGLNLESYALNVYVITLAVYQAAVCQQKKEWKVELEHQKCRQWYFKF